jgi:hypothetical protein
MDGNESARPLLSKAMLLHSAYFLYGFKTIDSLRVDRTVFLSRGAKNTILSHDALVSLHVILDEPILARDSHINSVFDLQTNQGREGHCAW